MHTYRLTHGHASIHACTLHACASESTQTVHAYTATPAHTVQAEKHACLKPQTTLQLCKLTQSSCPMYNTIHKIAQTLAGVASDQPPASHPMLNTELLAALSSALGLGGTTQMTSSGAPQPVRKYFSQPITNAISKLPITVIKELKRGFKNYIPFALCTHKACTNATRATDTLNTEVGFNEKGEIKLKQRNILAAKDHYLMTDNFTEICKDFIQGLRKYLTLVVFESSVRFSF